MLLAPVWLPSSSSTQYLSFTVNEDYDVLLQINLKAYHCQVVLGSWKREGEHLLNIHPLMAEIYTHVPCRIIHQLPLPKKGSKVIELYLTQCWI